MSFTEGLRLGYLAAIIEGEGSIMVTRHRSKRKRGLILRCSKHLSDYERITYTPGISIANNSVELLEAVRDMIGYGYINPIQDRRSNCYGLYIRKTDVVLRTLCDILPYLMSERKKRLCELVIEFCESRMSGLLHSYNAREIEIFREVRKLNGKKKD